MIHRYYKIAHDILEVRHKRTRVIWGYIHLRVPVLSKNGNDRTSVMRVQRLGSDELEGVFHAREDAREYLEGLQC
jgi:hypothetical protein